MPSLHPGEHVVKEADVVRHGPQGPRPGHLTLTDHRLVFEVHLPQGGGGEEVRTTVNAPLGRIRTITSPGEGKFQVELPMQVALFDSAEAAAWSQAITDARSRAPPAPGPMGGPGGGGGGRMGPRGAGRPGGPPGPGSPTPPPPPPPPAQRACAYCGYPNVPAGSKCPRCSAPG